PAGRDGPRGSDSRPVPASTTAARPPYGSRRHPGRCKSAGPARVQWWPARAAANPPPQVRRDGPRGGGAAMRPAQIESRPGRSARHSAPRSGRALEFRALAGWPPPRSCPRGRDRPAWVSGSQNLNVGVGRRGLLSNSPRQWRVLTTTGSPQIDAVPAGPMPSSFPPRPRPGLAPVAIAAIVGLGLAVFPLAVSLLDHLAIGRVLAGLVEDLFHEQAEGARRLLGRRRTVAAGASLAAWARASALAHFELIVGLLLGGRVSDLGQQQTLADRPEAAGDEVDAQAGGDLVEHECHENHHVLHGLLLHLRLGGGRRRSEELGLEEHEPDDHDGQQIEPVAQEHDLDRKPEEHVRGCEVIDPEERRVPERHAGVQGLPEPHEDRQLDQGRNAAADRIDAVLLVQREGLLGLLLLVVLVFLLNLLEVRLKLLGPLGHEGLLAAERK